MISQQRAPKVAKSDAILEHIIRQVSDGRPLTHVCRDAGMPHPATFYGWLDDDVDLQRRFIKAREYGHDALAADILLVAQGGAGSSGCVKRDRLITDIAIRLLEKWDKRYSPRNVLAGDPEAPLIPGPERTDEETCLEIIRILKNCKARRDAQREWQARNVEQMNILRATKGMEPLALPAPEEIDIELESISGWLDPGPDSDTSRTRARELPSATTEIGDLI